MTMLSEYEKVRQAAFYIKNKFLHDAPVDIGIVLGSAQGEFVHQLEDSSSIPYSRIPLFPDFREEVPGHAGQLWTGKVAGRRVLAMRGRYHYYQGYSLQEVVLPVRTLIELGVRTLIITNAAGGVAKHAL